MSDESLDRVVRVRQDRHMNPTSTASESTALLATVEANLTEAQAALASLNRGQARAAAGLVTAISRLEAQRDALLAAQA